jgi:hypothetical protein
MLGLGFVGALVGLAPPLAGAQDSGSESSFIDCEDLGLVTVSKYNWDEVLEDWDYDGPDGNEDVVTITGDNETGGTWTSTVLIGIIIVKGGTISDIHDLDPDALSGTFDALGLDGHAISHVEFCEGAPEPTTTTTSTTAAPTTTTTAKPTTTTAAATVAATQAAAPVAVAPTFTG